MTFQMLASDYADVIAKAMLAEPLNLLAASNGTGLAHQIAHALRKRGLRPGRLVLLDPDPPEPELYGQLLPPQFAGALYLELHGVHVSKDSEIVQVDDDKKFKVGDGDIIAHVVQTLHGSRLTTARPSMGRIMQELRSVQQLLSAEEVFYHWSGERIVPYVDDAKEAAIFLVLSRDQAAVEAGYVNGVPGYGAARAAHQGRPAVRHLFGDTVYELICEGTHIAAVAEIGSGRNSTFNDAVAAFLSRPFAEARYGVRERLARAFSQSVSLDDVGMFM